MDQVPKKRDDVAEKDEDLLGSFDDLDDLEMAAEHAERARRHYAIAFDATSSMWSWWSMAQTALKQAIDEIKSSTSTPIQVQMIAYRDETCDHVPLEHSEWSGDTDYLKEWTSNVRASGGGDYPESVDLGLRQVCQSPANMMILLGDAPGRPESLGYREAQELGQQACPIYALYLHTEEKLVENFTKIAKLSGGKAFHLGPDADLRDIFQVFISRDPALQITYQPKTIEGKAIAEAMS